jgi:hypothetical protein
MAYGKSATFLLNIAQNPNLESNSPRNFGVDHGYPQHQGSGYLENGAGFSS